MNAVAPSFGTHVNHRVTFPSSLGVKNLLALHQTERERIHQRIARVARLKLHFSAHVGHAKTIPVRCHATDDAFKNGMVTVNLRLGRILRSLCRRLRDRPKAQRIHHSNRSRAHGKNVAQNATYTGRCALKRLNKRRVVVRFNFEGAGPTVANIDDAGVLTRTLYNKLAARRQPLQMHARGLVRAMLAPHHGENPQLR